VLPREDVLGVSDEAIEKGSDELPVVDYVLPLVDVYFVYLQFLCHSCTQLCCSQK
jgi:hypothetical protein